MKTITDPILALVKKYEGDKLPENHYAVSTLMNVVGWQFVGACGIAELNVQIVPGPHNEILYRFYSEYI